MKKNSRSGKQKCVVRFAKTNNCNCSLAPEVKVIREPEIVPKLLKPSERTLQLICNEDVTVSDTFSKPEINSSLRYAQAILQLENLHIGPKKINSLSDLTPYEQNIIKEKLKNKGINFPPDVAIYKDLIPLEVSTSELVTEIQLNQKLKKRIEASKKDIVPKLSDYYVPKRRGEYQVIVDSPIVREPPVRSYNGLALHKKISCWEMDSGLF